MNAQSYINEKKEMYNNFIQFIDCEIEDENYLSILLDNLDNLKICQNIFELKEFLRLLSIVESNHHRKQNFFEKIKKILTKFEHEIKQNLSNIEIFTIFKSNKRILLYLLENKIITLEEQIVNFMLNDKNYYFYFYPEINSYLVENTSQHEGIEKYLKIIDEDFISKFQNPEFLIDFNKNRYEGENISYISMLIRNDSIQEFVAFVEKNNYPLSGVIEPSFYDTNDYLISRILSLIEYATFFGSIQILKYLYLNKVDINLSLWNFAVRSNNPEIIHFCEENLIKSDYKFYKDLLKECILCHHNDIAHYIIENLLDQNILNNEIQDDFFGNFVALGFEYNNFQFIINDLDPQTLFCYSCYYNYFNLFNILLETCQIDINEKKILSSLIYRVFIFVILYNSCLMILIMTKFIY